MIRFSDRVSLGLLGVTGAITAALYSSLPARIATHFDFHGQPDSWQPRAIAVVMGPALAVASWAVLRVVKVRGQVMPWLAAATMGFVCTIHLMLLAHARDARFDVARGVSLALGVLYVALGVMLPRLPQNFWAGVRTPWTLGSADVWARTQRLTGSLFVVGGALVVAVAWAAPGAALVAVLGVTAITTITAVFFSWRIATA